MCRCGAAGARCAGGFSRVPRSSSRSGPADAGPICPSYGTMADNRARRIQEEFVPDRHPGPDGAVRRSRRRHGTAVLVAVLAVQVALFSVHRADSAPPPPAATTAETTDAADVVLFAVFAAASPPPAY